MKKIIFLNLIFTSLFAFSGEKEAELGKTLPDSQSVPVICLNQAKMLPGNLKEENYKSLCERVSVKTGCSSVNGTPLYHYEKLSSKKSSKKILVIGLIHGDELPAGSMVHMWMDRLEQIDPVSSWRIIPISNPDGLQAKTRMNIHGVDLNRNFQTEDWAQLAHKFWKEKTDSNPRRFPGENPASEPETQCIQEHIKEFQPNFVISIHTPYAVLDFDGPKINFPKFLQLPWQSLGNYPGSLGRYMWVDRKVPVLTIEMKGQLPTDPEYLLNLQDVSSQVARLSAGAGLVLRNNQAFNQ